MYMMQLGHKRSTLVRETPLEFAMKQGNMEAMDLLIEDAFGTKFQARLNEAHPDRVLIEKLGTGSYVNFLQFLFLSLSSPSCFCLKMLK